MKITLVALDLDGTLLDSSGKLSPGNKEALTRVQAQDVGVIIATGKTHWSAVDVIAELGLTLPGVYTQGMTVYQSDGTPLREIFFDVNLAKRLLTYLEAQELPFIAYNREGLLVPEEDDYHRCISGKYGEPQPRVLGRMAEQAGKLNINKLLVGDRGDMSERRRALERQFGQEAKVLQAVPEYIEILPQGINKGGGLRWLLQRLQVDPKAVLAMGDGENDIEMLQMAGLGVAVGNAKAEVKAIADYVVSSNNQDGVAEAMARFILADGAVKA